MKFVGFDNLLASTALGLVLSLSGHAAVAQQAADQTQIVVPLPDQTPQSAQKDVGGGAAVPAAPQDTATDAAAADAASQKSAVEAATANDTPAKDAAAQTAPAQDSPAQSAAAPAAATPAQDAAAPAVTAPVQNAEVPAPVASPVAAPEKAAEAPATTPAPAVSADAAISNKLRELVASKALDRALDRKTERAGVEAFYKARDFKPLWIADGAQDARAKSAIAYLAKADEVGLDPNDYPAPDFAAASTPEALAAAELKLTADALTFARHAQIGRVHFTRVAADISFNLVAPEPADVLTKLAAADDAGAVLDSYNPPMAEFKALRAKLAELRSGNGTAAKPDEEKPAPSVHIGSGSIMRPGVKDERVIALRKRLKVGDADNRLYDEAVVEAVKAFQTGADLDADGNVGPMTLAALNGEKRKARGPSADPVDTVLVNMERWRWYPRNLGNPHVIVNIPDYTLTLYDNDKVFWHTKIVAGKPGHATPLISAEMKFITVNPTWNVPPSIIEKEYLPALQQDPQALDRIGLKLTQDADGTVHIQQPPGARNALGRIRFNFPNKFLVYQHDTPDKYLFAKEKRAYSHGCMRVLNPFTYGEKLLSLVDPKGHYTEAKLQSMLGNNEININFPHNVWVHLTYQTAFVDENGKLQLRDDLYGWDAKMISILKGSERKVADNAIERAPNQSSKPVRMPVGMYNGNGNGGGGSYGGDYGAPSGPNFFDWLFSGGRQQQYEEPAYRPRRGAGPRYTRDGRVVYR